MACGSSGQRGSRRHTGSDIYRGRNEWKMEEECSKMEDKKLKEMNDALMKEKLAQAFQEQYKKRARCYSNLDKEALDQEMNKYQDKQAIKAGAKCPMSVLLDPPPFIDHNMTNNSILKWIRTTSDGNFFWSRLYTLLYVHAKDKDWIMLTDLDELFNYHYASAINWRQFQDVDNKPADFIRTLAEHVDSWFSPVGAIRIRLNTRPPGYRKKYIASDKTNSSECSKPPYGFSKPKKDGEDVRGDEYYDWSSYLSLPEFVDYESGMYKKAAASAEMKREERIRITENREQLFLMLLIHFPEGVSHKELVMIMNQSWWKGPYFTEHFWTVREFENEVLYGDTYIADIIKITKKSRSVGRYEARLEVPDLVIEIELLNRLGDKVAAAYKAVLDERNKPPSCHSSDSEQEIASPRNDSMAKVEEEEIKVDKGQTVKKKTVLVGMGRGLIPRR